MALPAPIAWPLATPRRNAATGTLLVVAAVALFALLTRVGGGDLGLWLAQAGTSASTLLGFVLLAQPARLGIRRAGAIGVGSYLLVGLVVLATGIPVYNIEPATTYLLVLWPTYLIWLHPCLLGGGLWSCPPG